MLLRAKIFMSLACKHLGFLCVPSCIKVGYDMLRDSDSECDSKVLRVTDEGDCIRVGFALRNSENIYIFGVSLKFEGSCILWGRSSEYQRGIWSSPLSLGSGLYYILLCFNPLATMRGFLSSLLSKGALKTPGSASQNIYDDQSFPNMRNRQIGMNRGRKIHNPSPGFLVTRVSCREPILSSCCITIFNTSCPRVSRSMCGQ